MLDRKEQNKQVFEDTRRISNENPYLMDAIRQATKKQYIVKEEENFEEMQGHRFKEPATIVVSKRRSLEAASRYRGQKVCVHNFASATSPGGGVLKGSTTQEDAICRCSTLYFNISQREITKQFHDRHKQMLQEGSMNVTYNDDCIYTPGVVIFKTDDTVPKLLPQKEWYQVDVITCAAPNLREDPSNEMNPNAGDKAMKLKYSEIRNLHVKRMRRILAIAKREKVDVVILGAFGCGAFYNPPKAVADAMNIVLKDYRYDFKTIEFAVFCTPKDMQNYDTFYRTIVKN